MAYTYEETSLREMTSQAFAKLIKIRNIFYDVQALMNDAQKEYDRLVAAHAQEQKSKDNFHVIVPEMKGEKVQ